jgi:hypothetical protein
MKEIQTKIQDFIENGWLVCADRYKGLSSDIFSYADIEHVHIVNCYIHDYGDGEELIGEDCKHKKYRLNDFTIYARKNGGIIRRIYAPRDNEREQ